AKGRTVISRNAHREFLDLKVNGTNAPGDEVRLSGKGSVKAEVRWSAATPLSGRIELVRNGTVVASRDVSAGPGAPAILSATITFDDSGWMAARRMDAKGHQVHTGAI